MSQPRLTLLAALTGAAFLGACSTSTDTNNQTTTTVPVEGQSAGVTRDVVVATPVPAPPIMDVPVIQTQPGPKGSQVTLNRVAVTGDLLTVSMTVSGGNCCIYVKVDRLSVIDDATSQRLGVLKDNAGNPMAAPLDADGKELRIDYLKPAVVWAKFPAPPATSKTVSIAIPGVAPFDAIPITR